MNNDTSQSQGMLLFRLRSKQLFAIGTLKLRELVPFPRLTHFPHSHPAVLGAANIRGDTIPIVDLSAAMGNRPTAREDLSQSFVIVTDCHRKKVGFLVRQVDKIANYSWRDIESPPRAVGQRAFISGIARVDQQLIQLIDIEKIFEDLFPNVVGNSSQWAGIEELESLQQLNLLIVDDSRVARKQLSDALKQLAIPFQVTDNGSHALALMIEQANAGCPIDVLVSDIEMPGLDGYELAFEVRSNPLIANAYIILHTSISSEISVSQAHQVGANEALTKFDVNELIQAMQRGANATIYKG